ncbi:MAG: hypothetical protein U0R24_08690 [Solirubrobacterales bacterium]
MLLPAAAAAVPKSPPRPVIGVPGGPHRLAARGSYCWEGPGGGLCADTIDPMLYAPKLRLSPGRDAIVRMGYPVSGVGASGDGSPLEMEPLGDRGRKFLLHVPDIPRGQELEVYIVASYDRGDGQFAIRISSRNR